MMSPLMEKEDAHQLIDRLPKSSTWEDLMHKIYVRETIERGLQDSQTGHTTDVGQVREKYGLSK